MSVKETLNPKRYELVPPDGGWGYVLWIALTINMIAMGAFMSCTGMIYNEMYIQLGMDSTSINILGGFGSVSVSVAGFITGPLLGCMSIRMLGTVVTIIFNVGCFAVAFVKSKELLFLSTGILEYFGKGVLVNLTFTILNQYFVSKRMLTIAVIHTTTSIVSLFTPQFVKWSLDEYGFQGTIIILTGINMQTFIAIALMQPVEWHLKKIEIETAYGEKEIAVKEKNGAAEKLPDAEYHRLMPAEKEELNNSDIKENEKTNSILREMFRDFYDIPFMKSFLLSNASGGLAIITACDFIFMIMLPQSLYFMDWSEGDVAWAISLNNFGELVMKVLFILFNSLLLKLRSNEIYIVGLIMAFFTRLGMLWSDNSTVMLIFIVMIGMARSVLILTNPLVIGDAVDKDKYTSAMGIYMLLYGVMYLVIGPLVGAIRDLTQSYGTAFYIITCFFGIVALFWSIELLYKRNKHKRVKKTKIREAA